MIENLKGLVMFNGTKVIRNYEKQSYKFKHMNKENLDRVRNELKKHYKRMIEFEKSYLDDKPDAYAESKFDSDNDNIISESLNKIESCGEDVTESLELIVASLTKFELYDNLKMRTLNICYDIYGDLGRFIK